MGFLSSLLGGLFGGGGGGGGVGGTIGKILGGLGGPVLGAYGASGVQGSTKGTQASTSTTQGTSANQYAGTSTPFESPQASAFRNALFGQYQNAINKAQQPIYGNAQKAAFINQTNQQGQQGFDALKQRLAASGGLNSGQFGQAATQLELGRQGNITNFLSQLPFQEKQTQNALLRPLLADASNLAGRAPVGQINTGTTAGQTTQNTAGQVNTTNQVMGPDFLRSLASGLGGAFGTAQGSGGQNNPFAWLSQLFNRGGNNQNSGGGVDLNNAPIGILN